jgi:2-hydroxyglutarate dehydrogenase
MNANIDSIDVLVIGAGVYGLAISAALSRQLNSTCTIFNIDQHQSFGQEASSHNSEVIHAGIYYKPGSYKALSCREGRRQLYDYCERFEIPFSKCGKYILSGGPESLTAFDSLYRNGIENGVPLELVKFKKFISATKTVDAIWSPESGIINSHALMDSLQREGVQNGVAFLYGVTFLKLEDIGPDGSVVVLKQPDGTDVRVHCRLVINCAGLGAASVLKHFDNASTYSVRPSRGRYYSLSQRWSGKFDHLLYPMPDVRGGLGVHLTIDLAGQCRLGPDIEGITFDTESADLNIYKHEDTAELKKSFFDAGRKLIPSLEMSDLSAGYVGVRCKLFRDREPWPEFVCVNSVKESRSLHLLGIESPGLTSVLSIAQDVVELAKPLF